MKKLYLYGAGDHGKMVLSMASSLGVEIETIYDDNPSEDRFNYIVIERVSPLTEIKSPIVITIGDNSLRAEISKRLEQLNLNFENVIHPSAIISSEVWIGRGVMISPGAIIQNGSHIGNHSIINTGAIIDHDCEISDYVHVAPGTTLCGKVKVGEGSLIGAGSTVIPGVKIGKWSIVGAGSVVLNDIPDRVVAFGSPAKIHRNLE